MRISTLLQICLTVAILMVSGLVLANWSINSGLAEVSITQERAQSTARDISDLLVLTHEYAMYSEDRSVQQWKTMQARIKKNLEDSSKDTVPPPAEALKEVNRLPEVFQQLMSAISSKSGFQDRRSNLLLNQLQNSSQLLADSVHHWGNAIDKHRHGIEQSSRLLSNIIPLMMLLILALLYVLINSRLIRPLARLNRAVGAVAKGDLTVRSATTSNDEFGELSRTFDAMAIDLVAEMQREIAERKQAEEALASNERFLKTVIETEPECIKLLDIDGNLLMMNPAGLEMIGADSFEQVKGQCVYTLVLPPHKDAFVDLTAKVFRGIPGMLEFEAVGLKGRHVWLETHAVPFRDEQGRIVSLLGITRDITGRKQMEAERHQLERQLLHAQKLESLGVLAGGIAHDFNNILTSIIGNTDLALMRMNPASPAVGNLHKISQSAARAADLASQMLAYSGKGHFIVETLDMNTLLEEMLHILEVSISRKIELRLNLARNIPAVDADATQMRQIVMNLIINASEAMEDNNGIIEVSTGSVDCDDSFRKDMIFDTGIRPGRYVYLEISDNGCGMSRETLDRIFDPFFTTKFTGRGLGMAAVQGIVRGHQGFINVHSEPGKGTAFKILLPASDSLAENVAGQNLTDNWKGEGKVLLVDDEESVRDIGSEMLRELGFSVITANDGCQAVEVFRENADVAFVLLDLTMPQMDGEQCFGELKRLDPDVKVIMSSGFSEVEVTARFAGKGLAGFVQKPYRFSVLKEAVRKV